MSHPNKKPSLMLKMSKLRTYSDTRTYCHHTPGCVKCGENQLSNEYQKDENSPATCAFCNGVHLASYKGCPKFKLLQKGKMTTKNNKTPENQDIISTTTKINIIHEENFPPLCQSQWSASQPTPKPPQITRSYPKKTILPQNLATIQITSPIQPN